MAVKKTRDRGAVTCGRQWGRGEVPVAGGHYRYSGYGSLGKSEPSNTSDSFPLRVAKWRGGDGTGTYKEENWNVTDEKSSRYPS